MKKVLIASHFGLATGALDSLKYFLGEDICVEAINVFENDVYPQEAFEKYFKSLNDDDNVIVLTDVLGGSVNQEASKYLTRQNTYVITGFNFQLLLQVASLNDDFNKNDLAFAIEESKNGMILMNDFDIPSLSSDDE